MAQRTGGSYTTLYVPEQVSELTYQNLMNEPSVIQTLDKIRESQFTIHGIGDALKMAKRRQSSPEVIENFNIILLWVKRLVIILINKGKLFTELKRLVFN